jgi:FtsP/CotA-like multicopper oxidase with cupredoxin domain
VVLVPLAILWKGSLVPSTYSVMEMGYDDFGGGTRQAASGAPVSVADLTGPADATPDVRVTLTARHQSFRLATGERVDGYTLNGTSPGPEIRVRQGQLLEATLVNADVAGGVTLHWHGVDVPNAEDGVAGVTQDAVPPGTRHVYRFRAEDPGTYWYHSHQVSHEQVRGGLLGPLVVEPAAPDTGVLDIAAVVHSYGGYRTVLGGTGERHVDARPGQRVRVRVINSDSGPMRAWASGLPWQVVAVDARDVHEPQDVSDRAVLLGGGARADIEVTVPTDGSAARVNVGGGSAVLVGPTGSRRPAVTEPAQDLDLLGYGTPTALPFDPATPDRRFDYRIGRRPGFVDGKPGLWWSINGHLFPDVPMFMVAEGDVVQMTIKNGSGIVHPMHLHGHHAVVVSRDGVKATGSPWWVDSLEVPSGHTFVVAFLADNPGVWMDHCHNLVHADQGLVAHLAYLGVTEPYRVGGETHNRPE